MKRITFLTAACATLFAAGSVLAQPGPRPKGPDRPAASRSLEERLDRLDARLKEIEGKLTSLQAPKDRERPAPKDRARPEAKKDRELPKGPGPGGRGFGDFGRGMSRPGGMSGFGGPGAFGRTGSSPFGGPRASTGDFERRLDQIIKELEQLKKDMAARPRPGR